MKVGKKTRSSIFCVLSQGYGDSVKQKHVRLEINDWRKDKKKKPLGAEYFGRVMRELEKEGVIVCVAGKAIPHWDENKTWKWVSQ